MQNIFIGQKQDTHNTDYNSLAETTIFKQKMREEKEEEEEEK